MRRNHAANLRRVLSVTTSRRGTNLFSPYPSNDRDSAFTKQGFKRTASSKGKAKFIATTQGGEQTARSSQYKDDGDTCTTEKAGNGASQPASNYLQHKGSRETTHLGRKTLNDYISGWGSRDVRTPGITSSCVLASAIPSGDGNNKYSVEAALQQDILNNIFNLPVPRLRIWLHSLPPVKLLQMTLNQLYSGSINTEKLKVAHSVLERKSESLERFTSCKQAFLLLKLQRLLLFRNVIDDMNTDLYGRCIQLLDLKINKLPVDFQIHISITLTELWLYLQQKDKLDTIRQYHPTEDRELEIQHMQIPLIRAMESSICDISAHTVPSLVKLLTLLQRTVSPDQCKRLHEISFLKIIDHVGHMELDQLLCIMKHLQNLESKLPLPLYFVCHQVLNKVADSFHYRSYSLLMRCIADSDPLDATSLKRVLLLYSSYRKQFGSSVTLTVEPFVLLALQRAFYVFPVSQEAISDVKNLLSNRETRYIVPHDVGEATKLPKGYHRKVRNLHEIRSLLDLSLQYLRESHDKQTASILDPSYLRRHYTHRRSMQLSLLDLLDEFGNSSQK